MFNVLIQLSVKDMGSYSEDIIAGTIIASPGYSGGIIVMDTIAAMS